MSSFIAIAAFAASSIVPAQPTSFEQVNLRMPVDSCGYEPATVRVTLEANTFRVTQSRGYCSPPGPPQIADVRLGMLPAGDYRVEVYLYPTPAPPAVETFSFQVRDPVEAAVFPPPPRPLTDYSGIWFDPAESGWGLSLHQGALHTVFGLLFVYEGARQPDWYSLQGGRWTSSTTWTATVLRTTGPGLSSPVFDPALVQYLPAGTATLDFTQAPGQEGRARFTYTINGASSTKTIQRMPL
ncbi:MAG: hypothetical protein H7Y14_03895 [Burkholderiales bacterium]|nr:hypothetical protein [Burkholderiales bacterium]